MKLTEENLLKALEVNQTRESLIKMFNVSDRHIRHCVAKLVDKGYAIKSYNSEAGYRLLNPRLSIDRKAIETTVRDLKAKAKTTKQRADAIMSRYQLSMEL